jgi:hypothetical protein
MQTKQLEARASPEERRDRTTSESEVTMMAARSSLGSSTSTTRSEVAMTEALSPLGMQIPNLVAILFFTFLSCPVASAMMHPGLGRFIQRDPLGYVDGFNIYELEKSQPVRRTDPDGNHCNCTGDFNNPITFYLFSDQCNVAADVGIGLRIRIAPGTCVKQALAENCRCGAAGSGCVRFSYDHCIMQMLAGRLQVFWQPGHTSHNCPADPNIAVADLVKVAD